MAGLPIYFGDATALSPDGSQRVSADSPAPTYSASTGLFTPPATPTDILALLPAGSNFPVLAVKKIVVSGTSTAGGQSLFVRAIFSGNGGDNGHSVVTNNPRDKYDGSSQAQVWRFTSNRTTGSAPVGGSDTRPVIDEADLILGIAGASAGTPVVFDFTTGDKAPTVRQAYDYIVVGLNGQTMPSGTQLRVTIVWTEQQAIRFGALGDSTTSNATPDLLNAGANFGGVGRTGATNAVVTVDNLGSNGFRLYDFLNNANGVTYSLSQYLSWNYDANWLCYGINDARKGDLGANTASCINRLTAMLDTAIQAMLYGTTSGTFYTSPKATRYAITAASWAANTATLTTTPHGYSTTETVRLEVAEMTSTGYNGSYSCTFPGATSIQYTLGSNPGAATVFGTVAFTTQWPATASGNPDTKIILWSPNPICADDAGDGTYGGLSASANTVLSGLWTGMTLAQAAQELTNILYAAYQPFASDSRILALLNKQDVLGRTALPIAQMTCSGTVYMVNQLHPGVWGRKITLRQIMPVIQRAIKATRAMRY